MDETRKKQMLEDYTIATQQALKLFDDVDRKYGTFAELGINNLEITSIGSIFRNKRSFEVKSIGIQG